MAIGLPVIVTLHASITELIEHNISGFLVPKEDANPMSEKVNYLIKHPQWQQMGSINRAYVEKHYDISKLNDELVEYRQVYN
jgi:colanic acid/amylovoran biosynthesis glycosyltransferase